MLKLIVLANRLDELGLVKEANILDNVLTILAADEKINTVRKIYETIKNIRNPIMTNRPFQFTYYTPEIPAKKINKDALPILKQTIEEFFTKLNQKDKKQAFDLIPSIKRRLETTLSTLDSKYQEKLLEYSRELEQIPPSYQLS